MRWKLHVELGLRLRLGLWLRSNPLVWLAPRAGVGAAGGGWMWSV